MISSINNGPDSHSPSALKLYIRYMVSLRCKMIVKAELDNLGIDYVISLQEAIEFPNGISRDKLYQLKKNLRSSDLELLDQSESLMIDKIISTIIEVIHYTDTLPKICFNELISENLGSNDDSILKIFTEVKGVSVTQFIVQQKIDRAKDLLLYNDLTLAEISEKLNYKNEELFVAQFKKITGLSPSYFMEIKDKRDKNIAYQ